MDQHTSYRSLVLRHQPHGEYHPYIPLPYERSPRDPVSGERIYLNVETENKPPAKSIRCDWTVDHQKGINSTTAKLLSKGEVLDHWRVELPEFSGGQTVRYRFYAENEDYQLTSDEYSFTVSTWINVNSIQSVEAHDNGLTIGLGAEGAGLNMFLRIELDSEDLLSIKLLENRIANIHPKSGEKTLTYTLKDFQIILWENPFGIEITRRSTGVYLKSKEALRLLVDGQGRVIQYRLGFSSPSDEAFYGFGERFNALDQRGNHLDNYVYGQYTSQGKRTYIPVPFFISSRGYGLWLNTNRQAQFDLACQNAEQWYVDGQPGEDASLELKLFFHSQPLDIVKAFSRLNGKTQLPPSWVFGVWMSSNDWNSQAEVLRQLHETQKQQIPASVLVIEAWSDEINFYIWNDAQYRLKPSSEKYVLSDFKLPAEGRWPDVKSMVDEIHQNDTRLVLWQNPAIKFADPREQLDEAQNLADQVYAIEHGYVIKKAEGSPHRVEPHMPWFGNSLVLDFSNPEAADWWFGKREYLVKELGVDGFKTDGGEHIWDLETRFYNGLRGVDGINRYPLDYEGAYYRSMQKLRGNDFVLFSRAGYTGSQQYPCHWAGDENSTWEAYRSTLRALLNVGICGLPFVGWDIAGFAGPIPTSELYLRAAAFSVFCPIMQYHSDVNHSERTSRDRTPWNIQKQTGDERVIPVFRKFANLRMNLMPYILDQARLSSETDLPLMRAMALVFPQDPTCRKYPNQYFFGDALLVAPVTEEAVTEWPVYLPEGKWRDLWTGEVLQGKTVLRCSVPIDRIPVFQKLNSILALNLDASGELASPVGNSTKEYQNLTLHIYPGEHAEASLSFTQDSVAEKIAAESSEDGVVTISLPALSQDIRLVVSNMAARTVKMNGALLPKSDGITDIGWLWDEARRECKLRLPSQGHPVKIIIS